MKVILLERIAKLGQMGDVVTVKDGYARNFLLPQGKALRSNAESQAYFETQRAELEARNLERKKEADSIHDKLNDTTYVVIRSAGETGQLYGSVSSRDIAAALEEEGFKVARSQISLMNPIKTIGMHTVEVVLHPEVSSTVTMNVARSEDEATRQAAGEDLSSRDAFEIEDDADIDLAEVFDNPDEVEDEALVEEADASEDGEAAESDDASEEKSDES